MEHNILADVLHELRARDIISHNPVGFSDIMVTIVIDLWVSLPSKLKNLQPRNR